MIAKYFDGNLSERAFDSGAEMYGGLIEAVEGYRGHMERMEFSRALGAYWTAVQRANRFIEEKKPWELAKETGRKEELEQVFTELLAVLVTSGVVLSPFMPGAMDAMLAHLGVERPDLGGVPPASVGVVGLEIPKPLFPRIQGGADKLFED